jgi:hypothetical protein
VVLVASCGARTGLDAPLRPDASHARDSGHDATRDTGHDTGHDALVDVAPPQDAHLLDVIAECATPTYCVENDPNYIYKCGKRIIQCGSLEQCEERCGDAGTLPDASAVDGGDCHAACVNPCLDTLGQDTSNGCEFYAAEVDTTAEAQGVCYAVFVVNQWKTGLAAQLEVDLNGTVLPIEQFARIPVGTGTNITYAPFSAAQGLAQNQVAILFLSRDPAGLTDSNHTDPRYLANCPPGVTPAIVGDAAVHGTAVGQAFHVKSNVPVVAYQMLPYGGGSARVTGATLLLPTNVWGDNYLAANAYHYPSLLYPDSGTIDPGAGPSMLVIAESNDTHVTINPVTPIVGGPGVASAPAGHAATYTLNQGQYVQFSQLLELSGSPIQSDKPVAVIGGSTLMDVPTSWELRGDHGEQMLPPVKALGSTYVGVRYRTRTPPTEESVPWRFIGAVNGTTLTYDPPVAGAPTTLSAHQLVEFDATGPFVVKSQDSAHPFYFAQYMTGGGLGQAQSNTVPCAGDPEFVNVISPQQYLPRYTFFTDPTYPETNLVVVRMQDAATGMFPDADLDCAGKLTGWTPVDAAGVYQYTRIDLSSGDFQGQNGCNNGVHTMTASFPAEAGADVATGEPAIGVTIWGWGGPATESCDGDETIPTFTGYVSYAYPAGANIKTLNSVVVSAQ